LGYRLQTTDDGSVEVGILFPSIFPAIHGFVEGEYVSKLAEKNSNRFRRLLVRPPPPLDQGLREIPA